jgi:succinylarginine dihydrolase
MREYNFDGLVGLTHNYAGLSLGNLASSQSRGQVGNPRAAVIQGLEKMWFLHRLGVGQAVLPPPERPDMRTLRRLGFGGHDEDVLTSAAAEPTVLAACSSASSMWAANAATVAASSDTADGRLHLTPANLSSMFHRSLEVPFTTRSLRAIFADDKAFAVHDSLPCSSTFSDEGAANHMRLVSSLGAVHVLAWGRENTGVAERPGKFPARQTLEASRAIARLHGLAADRTCFWQQLPAGIDAGAFHTDVLAVGHLSFLMLHEDAFVDREQRLDELHRLLGEELRVCVATSAELPTTDAVRAYPFNSQVVTLASGNLAIVAPREAEQNAASRRFLERVLSEDNPVEAVHYIDVNASMNNGGGPACLRLRVPLTDEERSLVTARVFMDEALYRELRAWAGRHYRDRITLADLADPALLNEVRTALDELSAILRLGSLYDFQR